MLSSGGEEEQTDYNGGDISRDTRIVDVCYF